MMRAIQKEGGDVAVVLVVVVEIAGELSFGTGLVDKGLHLVHAAELHFQERVLARLLGAGLEDFADALGLHIHLQRVRVLVHYDLVGIALHHHRLEVRVARLRAYARVLLSVGEIQHDECQYHSGL